MEEEKKIGLQGSLGEYRRARQREGNDNRGRIMTSDYRGWLPIVRLIERSR